MLLRLLLSISEIKNERLRFSIARFFILLLDLLTLLKLFLNHRKPLCYLFQALKLSD